MRDSACDQRKNVNHSQHKIVDMVFLSIKTNNNKVLQID